MDAFNIEKEKKQLKHEPWLWNDQLAGEDKDWYEGLLGRRVIRAPFLCI